MSKRLLTFEWDASSEKLEIHTNSNGLEHLIALLSQLSAKAGSDHLHLMTSGWGGSELSDNKQNPETTLINHVKVFKWNDTDEAESVE